MNAEGISILSLLICFMTIFFAFKHYGKVGLFVYSAIIVIVSNLQVLRLTQYCFFTSPVALGTVAFSTTFAVDNILTELYGSKIAKQNVWMSFFGYLFFICLMRLTTMHPIVCETHCINLHDEMRKLFSPSFIIFISSLISYVVCQMFDIFIISFLKRITKGKYLSARSFVAMSSSAFLDNVIFSALAWIVFAEHPIDFSTLWSSYIFMNYLFRLVIAVLCVPLVQSIVRFHLRCK